MMGGLFRRYLAVDAGSSHTVLAIQKNGQIFRDLSVIALAEPKPKRGKKNSGLPGKSRVLGIGREAVAIAPDEESGVRWVYPVTHGAITDPNALELILRKLIRHAKPHWIESIFTGKRMGLLVSPNTDETERIKFSELLRDFGFGRITLMDASIAAAKGSGLDLSRAKGRMVIDIGGGKTTLTTFSLGASTGSHWHPFGSRDLDQALSAHVKQRYRLVLHPQMAEEIKQGIGSVYPRSKPETLDVTGCDSSTGIEKKVVLDDNEIRDVLVDGCEPLILAIQQAFETITPEMAGDIAQEGILLTGGGALLSGLPEFMAERIGLTFRLSPDPINAAIRGAMMLLEDAAHKT